MTQEYTPVSWQDETTSQQGTLINAERLNQMQTAHHFADGLEEVDTIPTADPGVEYHKIVYCTADSTLYRWDGTEWTADIDDETKRLLEEEIARATEAEGGLAQDIADEATARETADTAMQADISALESDKLDKKTTGLAQTQVYGVKHNTQKMLTLGQASGDIPMYSLDSVLYSKMPTLYDPINDTVINYGWATAQIGAEATARAEADTLLGGRIDTEQARAEAAEQANAQAIANTYTKAEIDTALGAKADVATTYSKTETDTLLALKADQATTYTKTETDTLLASKANNNAVVHTSGAEDIAGDKRFLANMSAKKNNVTTATAPASSQFWGLVFTDKDDKEFGGLRAAYSTSRDNYLYLALRNLDTDQQVSTFTFYKDHMTGPSRAYNPANTSDVATIGTLDAYTPMVRTTGNQDPIVGVKKTAMLANNFCEIDAFTTSRSGWHKIFTIASTQRWMGVLTISRLSNTYGLARAGLKEIFIIIETASSANMYWKTNIGAGVSVKLTYNGTAWEVWYKADAYVRHYLQLETMCYVWGEHDAEYKLNSTWNTVVEEPAAADYQVYIDTVSNP